MSIVNCKTDLRWFERTTAALETDGFQIVEGVFEPAFMEQTCAAMLKVQDHILDELGAGRLTRAGEMGVLRLMMKFDPFFARFLETDEILQVVDAVVSPTAILHLQNGFILPSVDSVENTKHVFQNTLHPDFPRYMQGYMASLNALVAVSDFTRETGATRVVPGSHQKATPPSEAEMNDGSVIAECPAGSVIFFDSTVWHAAGFNVSGGNRFGINHQFTRSFLKQQIDYVRALGDDFIKSLPERSQQLLGWFTRVPTSLDDYYRSPEDRLYRAGQG